MNASGRFEAFFARGVIDVTEIRVVFGMLSKEALFQFFKEITLSQENIIPAVFFSLTRRPCRVYVTTRSKPFCSKYPASVVLPEAICPTRQITCPRLPMLSPPRRYTVVKYHGNAPLEFLSKRTHDLTHLGMGIFRGPQFQNVPPLTIVPGHDNFGGGRVRKNGSGLLRSSALVQKVKIRNFRSFAGISPNSEFRDIVFRFKTCFKEIR